VADATEKRRRAAGPGAYAARMEEPARNDPGGPRTAGRWALAGFLAAAGVGHFVAPQEFLAQVPPWFPARGAVVYVSGVVELALAAALIFLPHRRIQVGWVVAGFFVVVFPGNVSQAVTGAEAFGLDSSAARWVRLAFQPVLIVWALWCTGAWRAWRQA
jgi:uncharacterized membrane protein